VHESKPESRPERRLPPWTEPRVTVNGNVGQVDATVVPRYGGEPTFARLPRLCDVPSADVAILGVPFDTGVSYRPGARFGPSHIRESSRLLRPYNPAVGVSPFAALQVADAGDLGVNPFDIAEAIAAIEHGARDLLEQAPRVLTLGGDHTIALPLLRAVKAAHGPVYVSVDIDVLDPAFAPGTGTPEAGGLTSRELLAVLSSFAAPDLVGADIVEVAPAYDHAQITGIAAAHVGYELLSAWR
jgi:arginase family enzyme